MRGKIIEGTGEDQCGGLRHTCTGPGNEIIEILEGPDPALRDRARQRPAGESLDLTETATKETPIPAPTLR